MPYQDDLYEAYISNQMNPQEQKQYESWIDTGKFSLPPGAALMNISRGGIPQRIVDAYRNNEMTPPERELFEKEVNRLSGIPVAKKIERKPQGYDLEEMVTGKQRSTPETKKMRSWVLMPELNDITSKSGIKTIIGSLMSNPQETVSIIKENFPNVDISTDPKGNIILDSQLARERGWKDTKFIIPPGLTAEDIRKAAVTSVPYFVAAALTEGASLLPQVGGQMGAQTAIEGSQAATGGEFNTGEIALAGGTELGMQGIGKILQGGKGLIKTGESAAQTAVKEAEQAGTKVLTSDVIPPKTFAGKMGQAINERIPVIGTGPVRAAQQESRVEMIRNVLRDFGYNETAQASDDVMKSVLKKRGQDLTKYIGMKRDVIDRMTSNVIVPVEKTNQAIKEGIEALAERRTGEAQKAIDVLTEYGDAFQNSNLSNLEELRKEIGSKLASPDMATIKQTADKQITKIYKALNEDMGEFIKANGERKDFVKWKVANNRLSEMAGELKINTLRSVLKAGKETPENVRKMLFSTKPSDIRFLNKNLTSEGRNSAKVAILQEAVSKSGGIDNLSTAKFSSNLNRLSKSVGVFFTGEDRQVIKGLQKALDLTKRAEIAGVKPTTGAELTTFAAPSFLSYFLGGSAMAGLGTTAGIGVLGRIYESKPVRNIALKLARGEKGKEAILLRQLTTVLQSARQQQEK